MDVEVDGNALVAAIIGPVDVKELQVTEVGTTLSLIIMFFSCVSAECSTLNLRTPGVHRPPVLHHSQQVELEEFDIYGEETTDRADSGINESSCYSNHSLHDYYNNMPEGGRAVSFYQNR